MLTHLNKLNEIVFNVLADPKIAIVLSDTSIKNKVAMYITHIHCYELKSLELGKRTNSYIRVNTRELNRELFTR